jgi:hypothetical protein
MPTYLALAIAVMIVPGALIVVELVLVYRPYSYLGLVLGLAALAAATILHARRQEAALEMPLQPEGESAFTSTLRALLVETAGTLAGLVLLLLIALFIFWIAGFISGPFTRAPYTVHH